MVMAVNVAAASEVKMTTISAEIFDAQITQVGVGIASCTSCIFSERSRQKMSPA
jgi:hypothetical protein